MSAAALLELLREADELLYSAGVSHTHPTRLQIQKALDEAQAATTPTGDDR